MFYETMKDESAKLQEMKTVLLGVGMQFEGEKVLNKDTNVEKTSK